MQAWRPFPRGALDVICQETTALQLRVHVEEQLQITLPGTPFRITDAVGGSDRIVPGCIGLVNPGELRGAIAEDRRSWSARTLLVDVEVLTRLQNDLREAPPDRAPWFPRRVVLDEALAADLDAVWNELRRTATASGCESRLAGCLARLVRDHDAPPPADASPCCHPGVRRVREYLRAHVSARVSLDQLADVAALSRFHLLRTFARAYGISPHAYQMELRLARARTLLARGTPPSLAALDAGFADQSHLTRRMKEACGYTPAAYARQLGAPVRPPSGRQLRRDAGSRGMVGGQECAS